MTVEPDISFEEMAIGGPAWLVPPRVDEPEDLDLGKGSLADVDQNLKEMWRTNHYLGGLSALTQYLYPRLALQKGPITVLDLGTGGAYIPREVVCWARAHRLQVTLLSVDWVARNLAIARDHLDKTPEVQLLRADAMLLPVPDDGVDYVISSLFLHHFQPSDLVKLLRRAFRCARRGMIMTDLTRGWLPMVGFYLVQPVFARNELTRHDGALSIRRAYTPAELLAMARMAGLNNARVSSHWPWRMTLIADCDS